MRFYVVENDAMVERFNCDNRECDNYRTRERGMPMADAKIGFQAVSMERYDTCSQKCQDKILELEQRTFDTRHHY